MWKCKDVFSIRRKPYGERWDKFVRLFKKRTDSARSLEIYSQHGNFLNAYMIILMYSYILFIYLLGAGSRPSIPEAEIQPMFQRLQREATEPLLQFTQYVSGHAIRTNNDIEARGGTMASIAEPPDVASCRCTFLSSSFTCWQPSRSAWCLRSNWGEYSAARTAIWKQRYSSCGTSLTPMKDQRKVYWKPVPILTGPQKSKC